MVIMIMTVMMMMTKGDYDNLDGRDDENDTCIITVNNNTLEFTRLCYTCHDNLLNPSSDQIRV